MCNFGLSDRRDLGATVSPVLTSRVGGARESSKNENAIRECATACFVAAFASVPVVSVWFLSALIDWEGVSETIVRLFDLG